ncbi:MAG: hypothetical protein JNM95_13700 [Chitinophagaceae bacterium]|nr:hypothetical protein [Chitinophagaceae bacterium]
MQFDIGAEHHQVVRCTTQAFADPKYILEVNIFSGAVEQVRGLAF